MKDEHFLIKFDSRTTLAVRSVVAMPAPMKSAFRSASRSTSSPSKSHTPSRSDTPSPRSRSDWRYEFSFILYYSDFFIHHFSR